MKILYKGIDIYDDISLNYAVHEMYAEKQADSLVLRFNDPNGIWSKWNPATGDSIAFEYDAATTGAMFIHQLKSENGLYTVRALSMPVSGRVRRSKSWTAVRFLQLGQEIAVRHGLGFSAYGVTDQVYVYIAQDNETDFVFFSRLCMLEGCQMILYNSSLIVYNEAHIEAQTPEGSLEVGKNGVFTYEDTIDSAYGSAEVTSGAITGYFKDPNAANARVLRPNFPVKVNNSVEATRFAAGLLKDANKNRQCGSFSRELVPGCAAASIFRLTTEKASVWNGIVFLTKVRHDYVKNRSAIYFRRVRLEGY
jgi:hypothetical protein